LTAETMADERVEWMAGPTAALTVGTRAACSVG
jgi:hypothetical protein